MKKKLLILFTVSVLYVLFYIIFPVLFGVNDDTTMLLISSGNLTGTPDEHLIYQNIIIGYILKYLYLFFPIIEWYTIHLMSAQIISITIITYVLLKEIKDRKNFISILSLIALLFFIIYFIVNLQFTTTSFLLAGASYLLLYSLLKRQKEINTFQYLFIVFLLLWSFFIRNQVFLATTLIVSPFFIKYLLNKSFLKYSLVLVFLLAISFAFNTYKYNSDNGWKNYKEFTSARARSYKTDRPDLKLFNFTEVKHTSLSKNEIDLIVNHVFPTKNINKDSLLELSSRIENQSTRSVSFLKKILLIKKQLLIAFLLLILILIYKPINYNLIISSFLLFLLLMYLGLDNVLKARVFLGLLFALFLFTTFHILIFKTKLCFLNYGLLFFLWGFQILYFSLQINLIYSKNIEEKAISKSQLNCINDIDIYISFSGRLKAEGIDPLKVSQAYKNKKIITTGWLLGSPIYNNQLKRYFKKNNDTINMALIEKLIYQTKNDVYLIGASPESLKEYALEYGVKFEEDIKECELYTTKIVK